MNDILHHRDTEAQRDSLSDGVIGAAIEVHRALGPGLLESAYEECLCHELNLRGIAFVRQLNLPVSYKGINLDCGYRLDIVANNCLVVELKSVETLLPVHEAQLLTYLKLSGIATGLLMNFNVPVLKNGLRRMKL
jgi:GxxExxY protein